MTVQDAAVHTVTVPAQAAPADAPLPREAPAATATPEAAPVVGRVRPLTVDERQFALGLIVMTLALGTIIVVGLLVGQYVWS